MMSCKIYVFLDGKSFQNLTNRLPHFPKDLMKVIFSPIRNAYFSSTFITERKMVEMTFRLQRKVSSHIFQTFVPSFMLCISSMFSVFIPSEVVPGRMGLCVTSFLSLISLFNGARVDWPKTSYIKAMDIWTILCYVGVFYALVEYCLVINLTVQTSWEGKITQKLVTVNGATLPSNPQVRGSIV